jgi:hypothetical protein
MAFQRDGLFLAIAVNSFRFEHWGHEIHPLLDMDVTTQYKINGTLTGVVKRLTTVSPELARLRQAV